MKLSVVMIWSPPYALHTAMSGGLIRASANLAEELGAHLCYVRAPDEKMKPARHYDPRYAIVTLDELLSRHDDFWIFTSAGSFREKKEPTFLAYLVTRFDEMPPFAVWGHDEAEVGLPSAQPLAAKARLRMAITLGTGPLVFGRDADIVYPAFAKLLSVPLRSHREPLICMTCRMTTRKTVVPFVREAAPAFLAAGWGVEIHGVESAWSYALDAKRACEAVGARYCGPAQDLRPVHARARWLANLPFLKRGAPFQRRLELVTIEAAAQGCGGVVLDETAPIGTPGVVRVPRNDLASTWSRVCDVDPHAMVEALVASHNARWGASVAQLCRQIEECA